MLGRQTVTDLPVEGYGMGAITCQKAAGAAVALGGILGSLMALANVSTEGLFVAVLLMSAVVVGLAANWSA